MGNTASSSKFQRFSKRRQEDVPSPNEINIYRERGQAILRTLTESEKVDWQQVIRTANELHEQEQKWLKLKSRKERFRIRRRAQPQRKQNETIGSFSVNLLSYNNSGVEEKSRYSRRKLVRKNSRETSSASSQPTDDHSSNASLSSGAYRSSGSDTSQQIGEMAEF